jgi:hypothetical protein
MRAPPARLNLCAIVVAVAAGCGTSPGDPPLPAAVNTVPFTGGVYFVGSWQQEAGLQRFWPTRATNYYAGFQPLANPYFVFRPSDGQLFYGFQPYGVFVDDSATAPDSMVPTPPCAPTPTSGGFLSGNFELPFGFDGQDNLYYYCNDVQRNGQPIIGPPPGFFYVGVLADGRLVVSITDGTGDPNTATFAAMSADGQILSTLDHGVPPPYELLPESITVQGNDAFMLVAGLGYDSLMTLCATELYAYRLDPQSNWLPVRSIPIGCGDPNVHIVLSDGTVLMSNIDAADSSPLVTAYLPDGTKRVAWRLADSPGAAGDAVTTMVVGPRDPMGPSLRQE